MNQAQDLAPQRGARAASAARSKRRFSIRPARRDDLDRLVEIEQHSFAYDIISRRSLRRFLTGERDPMFVAGTHREVWGYALVVLRKNSRAARLYSIAIDPEFRGLGASRALLRAAERAAKQAGRTSMHLEVAAANETAAALYLSNGYRKTTEKPGYYDNGADAHVYEKELVSKQEPDRC